MEQIIKEGDLVEYVIESHLFGLLKVKRTGIVRKINKDYTAKVVTYNPGFPHSEIIKNVAINDLKKVKIDFDPL